MERVEQIRADLESRHNERVKQAEETYQKRTDLMKTQFNKKVPEIKDQLRQNLTAEHEKVLQSRRLEHERVLEDLKVKHQADLDEFKGNEASKIEELKQTWLAQQSTQNNAGESNIKPEAQALHKPSEPTEAEARELVISNATIRGILSRNITEKVAKAKEILAGQLKEEHEKVLADKLAESQGKANTAKEQAVMTEEKRNTVKLSMADNRARIATFKLTLVQKAADETPQKPVVEVWAVVKDARLPQASAQQPQQKTPQTVTFKQLSPANQAGQRPSSNAPGNSQQTPMSMRTFVQPTLVTPNATGQAQQTPATTSTFRQPVPITQAAQTNHFDAPGSPQQAPKRGQMRPPQNGTQQPTAMLTNSPTQAQPSPNSQIPSNSSALQPSQVSQNGTQSANPQATSNISTKPQTAPSNQAPNAGSGPATLRSLQNSGLPIARGGRGGPNPRGRGRGAGRGGVSNTINTSQQQGHQGRASPTGSQLSGGAKQFVPGNKRPREEGEEGSQGHGSEGEGGRGKRVRGGLGAT